MPHTPDCEQLHESADADGHVRRDSAADCQRHAAKLQSVHPTPLALARAASTSDHRRYEHIDMPGSSFVQSSD